MRLNKIALSLAVLTLIVLMIPGVSACFYGKVTGGGHGRLPWSPGIPGGSFGFNIRYYEGDPVPKGEIQYKDHATGMKVHGHDMIDLSVWPFAENWHAEFWGYCTVDGVDGFTFKVYVEDNDEPGKDDYFQIYLYSDGDLFYSAGNGLLCGNIQIHVKP